MNQCFCEATQTKVLAVETVTVTWVLFQITSAILNQPNHEVRKNTIKDLRKQCNAKGFEIGKDIDAKLTEAEAPSFNVPSADGDYKKKADADAGGKSKRQKVGVLLIPQALNQFQFICIFILYFKIKFIHSHVILATF